MNKETIGILFNDPEFTYKAPASRIESYGNDILTKLYQVVRLEKKIGADFVACTGDWFNNKYYVSYKETIALQILIKHFKKIYGIIGNHDITGYNFQSKNNKPIGVLENTGLEILDGKEIKINNVILTGTSHYKEADIDRKGYYYQGKDKDCFKIGLSHGCLIGFGTENSCDSFFGDYTRIEDVKDTEFDMLFNGHWHKDQGIVKKNDTIFCNIGSIARDDIGLYGHKPSVLIVRIDENKNCKYEQHFLEIVEPSKAFVIQKKELDLKSDSIADYMKELIQQEKDNNFVSDTDLLQTILKKENVETRTQKLIDEILEETELKK